MWRTVWNVMAVIGILCSISVICAILLLVIDDIRYKREQKKKPTYTQYFTKEDVENER